MVMLFRAVIDKLKALFAGTAVAELEAELLAREAERRAELYRLADRYDAEGLPPVADSLRRQLSPEASPAGSLPTTDATEQPEPELPAALPPAPTPRRKHR